MRCRRLRRNRCRQGLASAIISAHPILGFPSVAVRIGVPGELFSAHFPTHEPVLARGQGGGTKGWEQCRALV